MEAVSVIVPVYQAQAHLRLCLDSLLAQTFKDLEILCVDDGSTDQSPGILEEFARQDSRVKVLRQENAGPGAARNAGLEAAAGEYVLFLDADDFFEPALIETLLARARETGADIVICRASGLDNATGQAVDLSWMLKTQLLPGSCFAPAQIPEQLFQFTYGHAWDKLYRADFLRESALRFPDLPNSEDLVFVFQSLALARRIAIVDQALVHYRMNQTGSVQNGRTRFPEAPYQAACLLQDGLTSRGLYQTWEKSFLNWSLEYLIWHVANLPSPRVRQETFFLFRDQWRQELGFDAHPARFYHSRFTYSKYWLVKHAPYPVFDRILRTYQAWKAGRNQA